MPSYIVTLNPDTCDEDIKAAKKQATDQGGKIVHEYTIFKGFSVTFDEGAVTTLETNPHVKAVEVDGEVKTQ